MGITTMQEITQDQSARVIIECLVAKITDLEQELNNKDHIIMGLKKKRNPRKTPVDIKMIKEVVGQ